VYSVIAVVMTIGVYGFVGMIVKIDDLGLYLTQQAASLNKLLVVATCICSI
jgi:predicted DNA repair protein MutK